MDLRAATRLVQSLEDSQPEIIVSGVKEVRRKGKRPTWVIDIVGRRTGRMATLDEKDHWPKIIEEVLRPTAEGGGENASRP